MRSLLLSCLLGLGAAAALAQPVSEAPPSAVVLNDQDNFVSAPDVAFDTQGNQVVVWRRFHLDDRDGDVLVRRYDAAGAPLGPETQVNVDEADDHNSPRVAAGSQSRFVVVWTRTAPDGSDTGVLARVWDGGHSQSGEIQVPTFTSGRQQDANVGMDAGGGFVVVWESNGQEPDGKFGIFARRFSAAGTPLGPEFRVDVPAGRNARIPRVAVWPDGRFVVLWSRGLSEGGAGVFARLFTASGDPSGGEILLAGDTATPFLQVPAAAARAEGGFAAAWQVCRDEGTCVIRSRSFGPAGQPLGVELPVSPAGQRSSSPDVAVDARGDSAVTWRQCLSGPVQFTNCTAHARFFDPQGIPLGTVSLRWNNNLLAPVVAAHQPDFLLIWEAFSCIGVGCGVPRPTGIYGERYRLDVPPSGDCVPTEEALCLNRSRFQVEASYRAADGTSGTAQAIPLTADSGYFWFFGEENLELLVKVIDGCAQNDRFWVFTGGLTNVEVDLKVTDTETGAVKTYLNPQGRSFQPIQDTAAFQGCTGADFALPAPALSPAAAAVWEPDIVNIFCIGSSDFLCVNDSHFAVDVSWRTPDGAMGRGRALQLTADSGVFWFFQPDNLELVVKVLDGCAVNGSHWVFAAGLTNVEVELRVEDIRTGQQKVYRNPQGRSFQPIQDTRAFPNCP
ncbi:MAG TPA: hypothetical protein VLQ45_16930 [Thermoanaerobaculia bacterium]|nr:hypothetical protein [Thermoanaerobaculia bacterium]